MKMNSEGMSNEYKALPSKVANQVLLQVQRAWKAIFAAMDGYRACPDKFTGRPKLPKYLPKTRGRTLVIFAWGCIWKAELRGREIAVSHLRPLGETKQQPSLVHQVRLVRKTDHDVLEVVYEAEEQCAEGLAPDLFVALDPGVTVLAALTSNKPGFLPRLVSGNPLKASHQLYNQQRAHLQQHLPRGNEPHDTSQRLDRFTTKRNRRVMQYLHTASRRSIELLVEEGIGVLVLGKNPLWQTHVELGKKHNQEFVQLPHARFWSCSPTKQRHEASACWSPKRATPAKPASWIRTPCPSMTLLREPSKRRSPALLVVVMGAGIVSRAVPPSMPM
jgi:putative transposase